MPIGADPAHPPKLVGTVIGPVQRLAIFLYGPGGTKLVRHEGERIGAWTMLEIRPGEVRAAGPGGEDRLLLGRGGTAPPVATRRDAALALHGQGGNEQQPE